MAWAQSSAMLPPGHFILHMEKHGVWPLASYDAALSMRNVEIFDLYSILADPAWLWDSPGFFKPQGVTVSGPFSEVRIREELLQKKNVFFRITSPHSPQFATCTTFLDVKNDVLTRITEPSNDDYDNDGSDNCDYNFVTFDDFGVKNDQQVYT